jgi:hypothetical protein
MTFRGVDKSRLEEAQKNASSYAFSVLALLDYHLKVDVNSTYVN